MTIGSVESDWSLVPGIRPVVKVHLDLIKVASGTAGASEIKKAVAIEIRKRYRRVRRKLPGERDGSRSLEGAVAVAFHSPDVAGIRIVRNNQVQIRVGLRLSEDRPNRAVGCDLNRAAFENKGSTAIGLVQPDRHRGRSQGRGRGHPSKDNDVVVPVAVDVARRYHVRLGRDRRPKGSKSGRETSIPIAEGNADVNRRSRSAGVNQHGGARQFTGTSEISHYTRIG